MFPNKVNIIYCVHYKYRPCIKLPNLEFVHNSSHLAFWNSHKGIDEDKEFVPNHDEGMLMENKIKSIAEIVVDERQGGNWKKSSFASRSESRDMGH